MAQLREGKRWNRLASDERRAQILATARDLFSQRPYGSVSTTEIADIAGVTRGLLHHYFGTKRGLYLEAVRELVATPVVPMLEELGPDSEKDDHLWERSVDAWMTFIEANRDAWLLAINAGETGRDRDMQEILDKARERTVTQVIRVIGVDEAAIPEVRTMVRAFGRFTEEITREWLEHDRISRDQARQFLVGSLPPMVNGLLPAVVELRPAAAPRPTAGRTRKVAAGG